MGNRDTTAGCVSGVPDLIWHTPQGFRNTWFAPFFHGQACIVKRGRLFHGGIGAEYKDFTTLDAAMKHASDERRRFIREAMEGAR